MANLIFLTLINFLSLKIWSRVIFYKDYQMALEESKNKTITKLPVGSAIIANNYFWLHGRKPFKENEELSRELLRIRGSFFIN